MTIEVQHPRWSGDAGARRLYATVRRACSGGEDLPTRLGAGLGAALEMLAGDPELARSLAAVGGCGTDAEDAEALVAQDGWIDRFGDLLDDAVAGDPRVGRKPPFLAPFLVGGLRFQIARLALGGQGSELPRLLPDLLEALLAYYFEAGESRRLARDFLDARPRTPADHGDRPPGAEGARLPGPPSPGPPPRP